MAALFTVMLMMFRTAMVDQSLDLRGSSSICIPHSQLSSILFAEAFNCGIRKSHAGLLDRCLHGCEFHFLPFRHTEIWYVQTFPPEEYTMKLTRSKHRLRLRNFTPGISGSL